MAREKMFDPAFLKAVTEAINNESKIRDKWHFTGPCALPHTAKVDWDADPDDDGDSDLENDSSFESSATPLGSENKQQHDDEDALSTGLSESSTVSNGFVFNDCPRKDENVGSKYIFPICNICDFGWRYDSRKKLVCPHHRSKPDLRFCQSIQETRPMRRNIIHSFDIEDD